MVQEMMVVNWICSVIAYMGRYMLKRALQNNVSIVKPIKVNNYDHLTSGK